MIIEVNVKDNASSSETDKVDAKINYYKLMNVLYANRNMYKSPCLVVLFYICQFVLDNSL